MGWHPDKHAILAQALEVPIESVADHAPDPRQLPARIRSGGMPSLRSGEQCQAISAHLRREWGDGEDGAERPCFSRGGGLAPVRRHPTTIPKEVAIDGCDNHPEAGGSVGFPCPIEERLS